MPDKKKNVVLPIVAAAGLALLLWLAFHNGSSDPAPAPMRAPVKTSHAAAGQREPGADGFAVRIGNT